ncbi:unnamed protein product [Urochloa decumbens]|uniref:Uncharacterized protein n=1 Tax=Urochloa decumbens TaxID=240449 RepID=A0ABC9DUR7_9POAL
MFRAGGSRSSLKPASGSGSMRVHSHRAPDQALPFAPPNAIKVPSPAGWKKLVLMQEISKTLKSVSSTLVERFIETTYRFSEQPSLNEGNFRPVNEIGEAVVLNDLSGEVPEDFPEGVYIRNGPNPLHPTQTIADSMFGSTSYMYYEGHGMLHAMYFNKSSLGEWKISFGKAVKDSANTNIFEHAGRAFAVTENHLPYEIDINNLNTLGPYSINGAWDQPFTSHPKKIQGSGDLVIMGTNTEKPHYVLGVISSDGERLLHKVDLKFEEGKLIHDIGVTTKYNIILDYPLRFGISRTFVQKPFIENDMNGKSRIGVMPRFGDADSIIWFHVANHCSYHLFNCFEDGNEVVVRGCRLLGSIIPSDRHRVNKSKWYGRAFLQPDQESEDFDPALDGILFSRPYEWRLDLERGTTNEGVDSLATSKTGLFKFKMIAKLHFDMPDKENKNFISVEYHALKEKQFCSGVQFVAKESGIDEDDGWVVTYVHDEGTSISQVYIIDAKRFTEEPVAKITLPQRVPYGFHGNYFHMAEDSTRGDGAEEGTPETTEEANAEEAH